VLKFEIKLFVKKRRTNEKKKIIGFILQIKKRYWGAVGFIGKCFRAEAKFLFNKMIKTMHQHF
jgi:hypothetical protein